MGKNTRYDGYIPKNDIFIEDESAGIPKVMFEQVRDTIRNLSQVPLNYITKRRNTMHHTFEIIQSRRKGFYPVFEVFMNNSPKPIYKGSQQACNAWVDGFKQGWEWCDTERP